MEKEESILLFWDANRNGMQPLREALVGLKKEKYDITTIIYLVCEYIYNDDKLTDEGRGYPDKKERNTKERIEEITKFFADSNQRFIPIIIPEKLWKAGDADDLQVIEKSITEFVLPKVVKYNPNELHIVLNSGTQSIRFAWISLYTKSILTRSFGDNVNIWQLKSDRGNKINNGIRFFRVNVAKNPYIDAIESSSYNSEKVGYIDLDFDGKIRRNAVIDVPLLLLGERGIGKSTIVTSTIVPEKISRGFITNTNIQTVVCGQLDSSIAASELFGYEKGAFTGADKRFIGKVELAKGGVLFLDEIQDLPKNIQRELLRTFQEKKFRRVGGNEELDANFNLICASNLKLNELQKRLDSDFFDRIATFKTYLKPLREQPDSVLNDLWNNRWIYAVQNKGFILPETPDDFEIVKDALKNSKMFGNIRDIEQLIAYIARDVYQGSLNVSDNALKERYKQTINEWHNDYKERYEALRKAEEQVIPVTPTTPTNEKKELENVRNCLKNNTWKGLNSLFKCWLAETAVEAFGSRKEAAKNLQCDEKTFYNSKNGKE